MFDTRFTVPLYTISAAAYHLGIDASKLNRWIKKDGLLTVLAPETQHGARLPFVALVEAQLYCEFRRGGLSLQAIASGMRVVREKLGSDMFKEGVLAYDGLDILMNLAKTSDDPEWIRAKDLQSTIPKIVDEGLRLITWDEQKYPQAVKLTAYGDTDVVADYRYAFGQPIIGGTRTRVEDVIHLFKSGEALQSVSDELEVESSIVESIIRTHVASAA
jgi:uncharacterized protein (DUF433 family)